MAIPWQHRLHHNPWLAGGVTSHGVHGQQRGRTLDAQMDIMGGLLLADGSEAKLITGVDDHSRFCVIASVVVRPTGRMVCAFATAMRVYGVPLEVLTDNGKQFTGRFGGPKAGEVLFERVCRENGIKLRHTAPRTPTTTGKIERFHQSVRRELLEQALPFASIEAAQSEMDAFAEHYNTARPYQGLGSRRPHALAR